MQISIEQQLHRILDAQINKTIDGQQDENHKKLSIIVKLQVVLTSHQCDRVYFKKELQALVKQIAELKTVEIQLRMELQRTIQQLNSRDKQGSQVGNAKSQAKNKEQMILFNKCKELQEKIASKDQELAERVKQIEDLHSQIEHISKQKQQINKDHERSVDRANNIQANICDYQRQIQELIQKVNLKEKQLIDQKEQLTHGMIRQFQEALIKRTDQEKQALHVKNRAQIKQNTQLRSRLSAIIDSSARVLGISSSLSQEQKIEKIKQTEAKYASQMRKFIAKQTSEKVDQQRQFVTNYFNQIKLRRQELTRILNNKQ